jgi:prevent-host-death family protein
MSASGALVTTTLNLYEAKTHLSSLVERAAAGEEIVIAKAGKPMARLVALGRKPLRSGLLKGKVWMADEFDDTSDEIIRSFEESEIFPPEDQTG